MKVKAIVFDLDNTLYDETLYLRSVFTAFLQVYQHSSWRCGIVDQITSSFRSQHQDVLKGMLGLIEWDQKQYHDELFQLYCQHRANIDLTQTTKQLLIRLKKQGYLLGVLTNGVVNVQRNKVNLLSLSDLVDTVVYARENGAAYEKPHKQAFIRVCQELNVDVTDAVMIGDNYNCDIKGALKAGLMAIYLNKKSIGNCDIALHTINQLHDLEELINYDK